MTTLPAPRTSRAVDVGLWTLQILLAAIYVFSAVGKLTADPTNVAGFAAMGLGTAGMYLVGAVEIAGAIGLLIPRLTGLAATCLVLHMALAVVLTLAIGGGPLALVPATVLILVGLVAWGRRDRTLALVARLRHRSGTAR